MRDKGARKESNAKQKLSCVCWRKSHVIVWPSLINLPGLRRRSDGPMKKAKEQNRQSTLQSISTVVKDREDTTFNHIV
jgi:hypothetical protein